MADTENTRAPAGGSEDAEHAAWLADKIVALGDYAKEAAEMLRRWPAPASAPLEALLAVVGRYMCEDIARGMTGTSLHADASAAVASARECRGTPAAGGPLQTDERRLRRAFQLGQDYWRLADSDSYKDHKRSDEVRARFEELVAASSHQAAPSGSGEVDGSDTRNGGE